MNNMFIKLCGLIIIQVSYDPRSYERIIVRCVNIKEKIVFILDFSFYTDIPLKGSTILPFILQSKPLRNRIATPLVLLLPLPTEILVMLTSHWVTSEKLLNIMRDILKHFITLV